MRYHNIPRHLGAALLAIAAPHPISAQTPSPDSAVAEYRGARWFDGSRFVTGSRFVRAGRFVARPRRGADTVVSLAGRYVVPPYADAHTHSPDARYNIAAIRDMYLRAGVFYVQVLGNSRVGRREIAADINTPTSIDAVFADMPVTAAGGHPQMLYEGLGLFRAFPSTDVQRVQAARSRAREGEAYLTLDSLAQLPAVVRRLRRDTVPLLKVMLLDTEHRRTMASDSLAAGSYGLDASVLRALVDSGHAMGRRVWAHVETAYDVQLAMDAGIDGLAHVPGYGVASAPDSTVSRYLLPDALARRVGRSRIPVVTTIGLATGASSDSASRRRIDAVFVENIRRLAKHGAQLLTGSDTYADADIIRRDAELLNDVLGGNGAALLRLRAVTTARAIFPQRRIGQLAPGFEASFLALTCNPLERRACHVEIGERVKQGVLLAPLAPASR
jgi:imidazolonepropionase-like amidohydrolase